MILVNENSCFREVLTHSQRIHKLKLTFLPQQNAASNTTTKMLFPHTSKVVGVAFDDVL